MNLRRFTFTLPANATTFYFAQSFSSHCVTYNFTNFRTVFSVLINYNIMCSYNTICDSSLPLTHIILLLLAADTYYKPAVGRPKKQEKHNFKPNSRELQNLILYIENLKYTPRKVIFGLQYSFNVLIFCVSRHHSVSTSMIFNIQHTIYLTGFSKTYL